MNGHPLLKVGIRAMNPGDGGGECDHPHPSGLIRVANEVLRSVDLFFRPVHNGA
jgi:hypothetical protein